MLSGRDNSLCFGRPPLDILSTSHQAAMHQPPLRGLPRSDLTSSRRAGCCAAYLFQTSEHPRRVRTREGCATTMGISVEPMASMQRSRCDAEVHGQNAKLTIIQGECPTSAICTSRRTNQLCSVACKGGVAGVGAGCVEDSGLKG